MSASTATAGPRAPMPDETALSAAEVVHGARQGLLIARPSDYCRAADQREAALQRQRQPRSISGPPSCLTVHPDSRQGSRNHLWWPG